MSRFGKLTKDYVSKELSFERVGLNSTIKKLANKYEKEEFMFYETINKGEKLQILSKKPQIISGEKCYLVSFCSIDEPALAVVSDKEFKLES